MPGPTAGKTPPRYQSLYIVLKPEVGCRVGVWGVESVLEMKIVRCYPCHVCVGDAILKRC